MLTGHRVDGMLFKDVQYDGHGPEPNGVKEGGLHSTAASSRIRGLLRGAWHAVVWKNERSGLSCNREKKADSLFLLFAWQK